MSTAALSDPRRINLADCVLSLFIQKALRDITRTRQKFTSSETGDYETDFQNRDYKSWSIATDLEIATVNALVRAFFCSNLLQKPVKEYLIQWNYIKACLMFQIWKHTDPDLSDLVSRHIVLNSRRFEIMHGRLSLEVTTTNEWLAEASQYRSHVAQFLSLREAAAASEPPVEISRQSLKNTLKSVGGGDLILNRAHAAVHKI